MSVATNPLPQPHHFALPQERGLPPLPVHATVGLSRRVALTLAAADIHTFEQLAALSDHQLLEIPNLAYAGLVEIRTTLHRLGLNGSNGPGQEPDQRRRTALDQELWQLTEPAGGPVDRGIALIHFGWDGRMTLEQLRNRYRISRDLLRRILLKVETQPAPRDSTAIHRALRFVLEHSPRWVEEAEELLRISGLTRQRVTMEGLLHAARIAALEPGVVLTRTPRLMVIAPDRIEACRIVTRAVQHLARIRGTTTIPEVRACAEVQFGRSIDSGFVRRAMALLPTLHWIDHRLGIVTLHR